MKYLVFILFFLTNTAFALTKSETHCLAFAVFKEANLEPDQGRIMVKDVILNRAKANNKTVCQVIQQSGQFTFAKSKHVVANKIMLQRYNEIANKTLLSQHYIYFFNKRLHPKWARKFKCNVVGNHKFCKEK